MQDITISDDLRQLSHGQVTARKFSRYDINGYRFRIAKLEASRPLAATTNSGVVTMAVDASGNVYDYYGVLQNIIEYTFGGAKKLRVVFFECEWFDPVSGTRVDDFGMVEVKHNSRLSGRDNNIVLAHQAQQVYYLSYPHPSLKNWWVVYKVNPEVHPRRYDAYLESTEEDDIVYQEIFEGQTLTVSDGAELAQLATGTVELMTEEPGPSKKDVRRSQRIIEKEQRLEQLNARVVEADSDADDF
jgi:hypothetical protein